MQDRMIKATDPEYEVEEFSEVAQAMTGLIEKAFDFSRDGEQSNSTGIWSSEVNAMISAGELKSLFSSEDWVYIVVDLIATKASSQEMGVYSEIFKPDGTSAVEYDNQNPLNDLIWAPNPYQDYYSFMYNLFVELILMGNCVIWYNKRKNTLFILQADLVTIDLDAKGNPKWYLVADPTMEIGTQERAQMARYPIEEIIHIRRPNPQSLLWGLSPFIPGRKSVLQNRYSSDYLNAFYLKGATPGLAITMDRTVNEEMALRQLRSFENAYSGRRNQRRTLILPKGTDVKPLSHSIADQRLMETVDKNRETILGMLKIPKHELGLQTSGSLGSEEYKVALRNFWESTLKPSMRLVSGAFTKFFQALIGPNAYLDFDLDNVEALKDDQLKKAELAKAYLEAGWTINEVRDEVFDMTPSSFPQSDVPGPLIVKNQAPAPVAAPAPEPTPNKSMDLYGDISEIESFLSKAGTSIDAQHKALEDQVSKETVKFVHLATDRLVDMAEVAIKTFREAAKKSYGGIQTKDDKPANITDLQELQNRIEAAFGPIEAQYLDEYITTLTATVEFGYDSQLKVVLNNPNRDAIAAIRARGANKRRLTLEARGLRSFAWISQTQTERIMKEITQGMEQNETVFEITQRIASTFKDPDKMINRATVIARTETLTAVSQGQWAVIKDAQTVIPKLKKVWLTAGDERVRHSHQKNDHLIRDVDASFPNGLLYPRDPSGEAKEVIQCRCTLLMLPPGQTID